MYDTQNERSRANAASLFARLSALAIALFLALACLMCAGSFFAAKAYAEEIDLSVPCSLTLTLDDEGRALAGVELYLWRAATIGSDGSYTLTDEFAAAAVDLNAATASSSELSAACLALVSFAEAQGIAPTATGTVAEDGTLSFSSLESGLYVIGGASRLIDGYIYRISASCVQLPSEYLDGSVSYSPTVAVKYAKEAVPNPDNPDAPENNIDITAVKVWDDEEAQGTIERPTDVTVVLVQNGKVIETTTLSAENSWTHTWEGLPLLDADGQAYTYAVSEVSVPAGYSVTMTEDTYAFKVKNTYNPDFPGDTPGDEPGGDEPGGTTPGGTTPGGTSGGTTGGTTGGSSGTSGTSSTLPQTGQVNWPILVLFPCGMFLLLLGVYLRRSANPQRTR